MFQPRPEVRYYFYRNPEAYDVVLVVIVASFSWGFCVTSGSSAGRKSARTPLTAASPWAAAGPAWC